MKLRQSGRVMVTTTLVLLIFTGLVIWHDNPVQTNEAETEAIQSMIQGSTELKYFLNQIDGQDSDQAFYSVGLGAEQSWPTEITRACYHDPLVAWAQFSDIQRAYSSDIEVVRYRSQADFCLMLLTQVNETPNYISMLKLNSHTPVKELPAAISLKLGTAVLMGIFGLLIIRRVS